MNMLPREQCIRVYVVIAVVLIAVVTPSAAFAQTNLSEDDRTTIIEQVNDIERAIEGADTGAILTMVPDRYTKLRREIQVNVTDRITVFDQSISDVERTADGNVRVYATFHAEGRNWQVNGMRNTYEFEKHDGQWRLVGGTFARHLQPSEALWGFVRALPTVLWVIVGFIGLVSLLGFAFWIWMLIDVVQRPMKDNDKVVWIILLIFLQVIGAIIYFFTARRKHKKQQILSS